MRTWSALLAVLTTLFFSVQVAYRTGAEAVRTRSGAVVTFGRGSDQQLFEVGPGIAVALQRSAAVDPSARLPLVIPEPVAFPLSAMCGAYESGGFIRDPEAARTAPALAGHPVVAEPHPIPGERDRVTVQMPASEAVSRLRPMSTCNESCVTFSAAFLFLYLVLFVSAPLIWMRSRRARPRLSPGA